MLTESPAWQPVLAEYPGYDQYMQTSFGPETSYVLTPPKIPVAAFLDSRLTSQVSTALLGLQSSSQALAAAQKEVTEEYQRPGPA